MTQDRSNWVVRKFEGPDPGELDLDYIDTLTVCERLELVRQISNTAWRLKDAATGR